MSIALRAMPRDPTEMRSPMKFAEDKPSTSVAVTPSVASSVRSQGATCQRTFRSTLGEDVTLARWYGLSECALRNW
jgi:hypothetical protein